MWTIKVTIGKNDKNLQEQVRKIGISKNFFEKKIVARNLLIFNVAIYSWYINYFSAQHMIVGNN